MTSAHFAGHCPSIQSGAHSNEHSARVSEWQFVARKRRIAQIEDVRETHAHSRHNWRQALAERKEILPRVPRALESRDLVLFSAGSYRPPILQQSGAPPEHTLAFYNSFSSSVLHKIRSQHILRQGCSNGKQIFDISVSVPPIALARMIDGSRRITNKASTDPRPYGGG